MKVRLPGYLAVAAIFLLSGLLILASVQNRSLMTENSRLASLASRLQISSIGLPKGVTPPALRGTTLTGQVLKIGGADSQHQIIYFFSTSCEICKSSNKSISKLANQMALADESSSVVGVSASERPEVALYVQRYGFHFPVVVDNDRTLIQQFRAFGVPLLIGVGADGRVSYQHAGLFSDEDIDAAIHAINLGKSKG